MSQTFRERRNFPVPMRASRRQRSLSTRSTRSAYRAPVDPFRTPARCLLHASNLASFQIRRPHPVGVTSTLQLGAAIKSP